MDDTNASFFSLSLCGANRMEWECIYGWLYYKLKLRKRKRNGIKQKVVRRQLPHYMYTYLESTRAGYMVLHSIEFEFELN
mmetsp:Transcript_60790/g.68030  ORF Transcript_60790/g.68030 Transcript_60790/m.68030 type:complete len:80 (+) Transcript_60790:683-922(+)